MIISDLEPWLLPTPHVNVSSPRRKSWKSTSFSALVKLEGSDLHLKVGSAPVVRVHGTLRPLNREPIDTEEMVRLIFPMLELQERRKRIFDEDGGVDFAHTLDLEGKRWRFRVNVLQQMGQVGMVARRVNNVIPDFEHLFLPPSMAGLCEYSQGMVLLAGVTGSGKSTTIASMLDWINHRYRKHILTLEDPIEFTFTDDKCLINQREIGMDVKDFGTGMKHAVRRRPGRHAGGRDARPGDVRDGDPGGGDRPPGVRHDPRLDGPQHHRPYPRPVPAEHASRAAQCDGLQHESHYCPEAAALDQARRGARSHQRDHDL